MESFQAMLHDMCHPSRLLVATLLVAFLHTGCDDAPVTPDREAEPGRTDLAEQKDWQTLTDTEPTEVWLASREAGESVAVDDPRVERMRRLLADAKRTYFESSRMIANRIVQVDETIRPQASSPPIAELLADLTLHPTDRQKLRFADVVHLYLNVRRVGGDHARAVATVKEEFER